MHFHVATQLAEAERAFDLLADDGPRVVRAALLDLAKESASDNEARSPLSGSRVIVTNASELESGLIKIFIGPNDIPVYNSTEGLQSDGDNRRVARWTDKGTVNQDAQHWFRKISKTKRQKAVILALNRTARRAGFHVEGTGL